MPEPREGVVVARIAEWLRGDEAEEVARAAVRDGVAPEDALAHAIEERFRREAA
jgi:hypothetical protein